ncbi:putative expansin [Lupinus albus]|uniref:Expansin n=1 Tax=Lupinus albus TaxID=3870 RepID=A0A6A4QQ25_LUPAL|nr:putative expansin [Lupinus albus]
MIRCVDHILWWMLGSPSVAFTATDLCPHSLMGFQKIPKEHLICHRMHFLKLPREKLIYRVKCQRSSGLKFTMSGSSHFYHVLITNVGNLGWMVKVVVVKMKGSRTGWIPIARNWGKIGISMSTFNISLCPLRSLSAVVHTSSEVSPEKWQFGQTFDGKQF